MLQSHKYGWSSASLHSQPSTGNVVASHLSVALSSSHSYHDSDAGVRDHISALENKTVTATSGEMREPLVPSSLCLRDGRPIALAATTAQLDHSTDGTYNPLVPSPNASLSSGTELARELLATRYGQTLLPPQERLEWLQKERQRMINTQSGASDPGLMMA